MSEIILSAGALREKAVARIATFLAALPDKPYRITIEPYKKRRSESQNAYLWGAVYKTILDAGQLEGWTADDLHEYFLGEHFGWETLEGFGRKRLRPLRRSSKLNTQEFSDFVAFIQQRCAELSIYIPDPNEQAA